ncbi:MAG: rRNA maturation RNase YbeY [Cytophagales bacterium]|nr:rRNA maturation RNase YbeY [Cytophagales bacterium]|tara:strand:- start:2688 stop:3116 length:429 start_codon:yes stop_codon:yes gene_type:complete
MFLTNFFSEKKSFSIPNKKKIRVLIKQLCLSEKKDLSFLNLIFCSDEYLLEINKKHLNHDYFTDVITFDFSEDNKNIEGDVYISVDRVADNAIKYKQEKNSELIRTIIHGTLHLFGYKDKTKKEKEIMTSKENKYLSLYRKN